MHLSRLGLLVHLVASLPWWHPSTSALPWHAGPRCWGYFRPAILIRRVFGTVLRFDAKGLLRTRSRSRTFIPVLQLHRWTLCL